MVQTSPTPFEVGRAFVHQYYTLLHQAPQLLHRFYSTDSTFIHGGVDRPDSIEQPAVGPDAIARRINDLNLRDCHAKIRQVDSHPTIGHGVVVQVTGELSNNGDPMRRFMQTFVLAPRQPKKYYVQNDIFRYQDEVFDDGSDEDDRSSSQIYGDTDKVSNADSSAAVTQQPLLVTATARPVAVEAPPQPPPPQQQQQQQQPLPPRTQQPAVPKQPEPPLNGLNEPTGFNGQQEPVQDNQQQTKQTPTTVSTEGTSYAGIAKLKSSTGTTSNITSTGPVSVPLPQQTTSTRPPSTGKTVPPNRPNSQQQQQQQQQQQRGNGNYFQPNSRNNQWNDNSQQDQNPPRRSGGNLSTAPNEQQVFVGSLPPEFTREDLIDCFKQYGNVLDVKIQPLTSENKKNFGFVIFDDPATASSVVSLAHVNYKNIRLNVEPKTQRGNQGNINNGPTYNSRGYGPRGGGNRGGNRGGYRGSGNQRRGGGGGQYQNNPSSFTTGDENYKVPQAQQQQQPSQPE